MYRYKHFWLLDAKKTYKCRHYKFIIHALKKNKVIQISLNPYKCWQTWSYVLNTDESYECPQIRGKEEYCLRSTHNKYRIFRAYAESDLKGFRMQKLEKRINRIKSVGLKLKNLWMMTRIDERFPCDSVRQVDSFII